MVTRNETFRRLSMATFQAVIDEATLRFAECIEEAGLPPLSLSQSQHDSGNWNVPPDYHKLVRQIIKEYADHEQYKFSGAQLKLALLQGTIKARRLVIDGNTVAEEPKTRQVTHWVARAGRRICHSRRQDNAKT